MKGILYIHGPGSFGLIIYFVLKFGGKRIVHSIDVQELRRHTDQKVEIQVGSVT